MFYKLKKYDFLVYGFALTYILKVYLQKIGLILIDKDEQLFNIAGFVFWGFVFSVLIYFVLYHKAETYFRYVLLGLAVTIGGTVLSVYFKMERASFFFIVLFWGLIFFLGVSWYMHRFKKKKLIPTLLKKKELLVKIGFLLLVFIGILMSEGLIGIPDNPLTFSLLIIFCILAFNILAPKFFNRYKFFILGIYGGLFLLYFYSLSNNESALLVTNEKERQEFLNIAMLFLLPVPFFILFWVYEQWKWFRNIKAEKTKAELALLKSQVNPHFFFNTLNNLYGLAKKKADETPDIILKLSEIMRYVIYKGQEQEVRLEEELNYLENYLELQQIRHHEKVEIVFDKKIADKELKIAPLLLIVFLENAFKHGVDSLIKGAYVHVKLEVSEDELLFEVDNNFDPEANSKPAGIGLENLQKRLEIIYEDRHQLELKKEDNSFKARLTLLNLS
ncbi:hypothetical protein GWK08_13680 [Leptobacterium flavescens]|uniref:Signal transduction histidine kinase internal region domain-containing protein n=1 Tax=Leptobacterium flavescens TaxID=472055 RepID=A0A6P0URT5_9FLAO|nr:histidine kinase [Leptobacterium flavescens]NER14499.1 hypothetical protein [Leptobacterium flavescens]